MANIEIDGKVRQLELLITSKQTPVFWTQLEGKTGDNAANGNPTRNSQPQK